MLGKRDAANAGYSYTWHDSGLLHTRANGRGTVTTPTLNPLQPGPKGGERTERLKKRIPISQ